VFDVNAPSSRLALDQFGKPIVKGRLLAIAEWSTGSKADAEDLVEDALLRVLDPKDVPWVPERGSFLRHMTYVMRQVWDRQLRKAASRSEVLDPGLARDENTPSLEPSPDDELHSRRSVALWRSLLQQVLAEIGEKHPLTRRICDLAAQGFDEPADQARIIGCDVDKINRARETLQYHARRLLEARDLAEQRRMKDLQEGATKGKDEATL
jgi:DNA-directed RNA polymerase specialized sigma24 family protein